MSQVVLPAADRDAGSLLALVCELARRATANATDWSIAPSLDGWWIKASHRAAHAPDQGWKLHLAATPASINDMLRRAVPLLLAEDADFKLIASVARLQRLNDGDAGLSQMGKSLTIYPNDDQQAVRLAVALDRVLRGLRGPAIPSDRPLNSGSLVHYRYGSFAARLIQLPNGRIEWALKQPDGELRPDVRAVGFCPPTWAIDPFIAAGVAQHAAPLDPLIAGRYLLIETLAQSARGTVARALDLRELRRCVLKRAIHDGNPGQPGSSASERLRHEAAILAELAPADYAPQLFELIERDDDVILVMEDLPGETLVQRIKQLSRRGATMPELQVMALGRALAVALQQIHDRGFVYHDLKPSNVILGPDQRVRLVDFELAYRLDSVAPSPIRGTRGYMSPQHSAGALPGWADDIYSLGALLYVAATCAEPGFTPQPDQPLRRRPELINPALGPALIRLIAACLQPDPADRPRSMQVVQRALAAPGDAPPQSPIIGLPRSQPLTYSRQDLCCLARRLGESLCAAAQIQPNDRIEWPSSLYHGTGITSRDLYAGSAGVILTLAELVLQFGEAEQIALLRRGTAALLEAAPPGGSPLGGLYFGEAGIAVAALRAGQALNDQQLVTAANQRGHTVARLPHTSPDLATGLAGRMRAHLLLWDQTADPEQLAHAVAAGERLLVTGEWIGDDLCWRMPSGYGSLGDKTLLGYAHGAAGIGDALLDLFTATQDARFRNAAHATARWIMRQSLPALDDGSGVCWPKLPGTEPSRALWCHGAVGIGQFLVHMAQTGGLGEAVVYAERAARTAAYGARWVGPTQCHGLAGAIELLLDLYQVTGSAVYLNEAHTLADLLQVFMIERQGRLLCQSDRPDVFAPDLMLGYGGVILCLLRLADPERRPPLLSRASFRYRGNI